jgi:hypothetical protein
LSQNERFKFSRPDHYTHTKKLPEITVQFPVFAPAIPHTITPETKWAEKSNVARVEEGIRFCVSNCNHDNSNGRGKRTTVTEKYKIACDSF